VFVTHAEVVALQLSLLSFVVVSVGDFRWKCRATTEVAGGKMTQAMTSPSTSSVSVTRQARRHSRFHGSGRNWSLSGGQRGLQLPQLLLLSNCQATNDDVDELVQKITLLQSKPLQQQQQNKTSFVANLFTENFFRNRLRAITNFVSRNSL